MNVLVAVIQSAYGSFAVPCPIDEESADHGRNEIHENKLGSLFGSPIFQTAGLDF